MKKKILKVLCIIVISFMFLTVLIPANIYAAGVTDQSNSSINWTEKSIEGAGPGEIKDVIWDGQKYIAINWSGDIFFSDDTKNWDKVSTGVVGLSDIYYGGGLYIITAIKGKILTSKNGEDWIILPYVKDADKNITDDYKGIAWNGSMFVIGTSRGAVVTSKDGANWRLKKIRLSFGVISSIAWSGKMFAAVGTGNILISKDGSNWSKVTNIPSLNDGYLCDILWDGNRFVAVGGLNVAPMGSIVITSDNGTTWNLIYKNKDYMAGISSIAFNGSTYVAICNYLGVDRSKIFISSDAKSWEVQTRDNAFSIINSVAWDGTHFICGAEEFPGIFISNPQVPTETLPSNTTP